MLASLFKTEAEIVHVCFDKYNAKFLKSVERMQRGSINVQFKITGSEQTIQQSGQKLMKNICFKNELTRFLIKEFEKPHYACYYHEKSFLISFGGDCTQYTPTDCTLVMVTLADVLMWQKLQEILRSVSLVY